MAEQSTALKAPPATARLKVDVWVHFGFKKDGKKRRVGQTTGNVQTMQRDGEILWEYDQSPQPLDKTSPGRNTVDTAQTNQPGAGVGPSVTGKLSTCTEDSRGCRSFYMQRRSTEVALKLSSHAMFCRLANN